MILIFLKLRFKQLLRVLIELGWIRSTFLLLLALTFYLVVLPFAVQKQALLLSFTLALLILILNVHLYRKDKLFLRLLFRSTQLLFFIEYTVLCMPLFILLLFRLWFVILLLVLIGLYLISLIQWTVYNGKKTRIFHFDYLNTVFEWKSVLRRNIFFYLLFYIGLLIFLCFNFISVVLFITFFTIMTAYFYQDSEPLQMMEVYGYSAKKFLHFKIRQHVFLFSLVASPFLVLSLILYSSYWYILLVVIVASLILQLVAITCKYSFYEPSRRLIMVGQFMATGLVCYTIPFLMPVNIAMMVYFYFKALKNLKTYLNRSVAL
jgi:hypothetical protein